MGILGTIIKNKLDELVVAGALDIGVESLEHAQKKLEHAQMKHEKKEKDKIDDFFGGAKEGHLRLIVGQKPYTFKEFFQIYDGNDHVKYVVKGKRFSSRHKLTVYDAGGKTVLGKVKEQLLVLRSPFAKDFVLEVGGTKLGKMKSRFAFGKRKYVFTFNNWILEGNILGLKYCLKDGTDNVMEVREKMWRIGDTYHIDIANSENELLCILVLLAIDSSHTSKSKDNERALRHKRSRYYF